MHVCNFLPSRLMTMFPRHDLPPNTVATMPLNDDLPFIPLFYSWTLWHFQTYYA